MNRFKLLFAIVAAFSLVGIATSSALASGPTLLFLGSEKTILLVSLPLDGSGTGKNETPTELQSSVTNLKGKGVLLELTLLQTPTGITGNYSILMLDVETSAGVTCNTKGDRAGELLWPLYPVSLVYWNTASGELQAGILFNVETSPELLMECGAATIKVKGTMLGSIAKGDTGERTTIFGGVRCSSTSGKPEKTAYTNSKGEAKIAALSVTTAGKTAEGCELIGSTATFEQELSIEATSPAQMATLDF
jgi:hypothetical protein